jgi:CheY-like chemotaxis protein
LLVVDDDQELRAALCETLATWDCEALGASDGAEALASLASGPPCLILLDLMMPGMNGWEFIEALRVHPARARIPVVVMSAYGTPEGVRSAGATEYLKKPFAFTLLLDIVSRHCPQRDRP